MQVYYDFICSLGGSCATAKQLQFCNMRMESLPFDWLFHLDNRTLGYLVNAFQCNFSDWMLFNNLRELNESERGDSNDFQYIDENSFYRFIHDFKKPKQIDCQYKYVIHKYKRRFHRLRDRLRNAHYTLFILDAVYKVDISLIKDIKECVERKFPTKVFFLIMQFNNGKDEFLSNKWLTIVGMQRGRCRDDYVSTPCEWTIIRQLYLLPRRTWGERLCFYPLALWHTLRRAVLVPPHRY